jgi:hypothetical protein
MQRFLVPLLFLSIDVLFAGLARASDSFAEDPDPAGERRKTVTVRVAPSAPSLSLAYRGAGLTALQPGLAAAGTVDLRTRVVRVDNASVPRGFRHRTRTFHAGGELGFSARVFGDLLWLAQGQLGTRMTRTSGLLTGPSVALGFSRSILMHPSWRVTASGQARRGYLGGQSSIAGSVGYEFGWDLARRRETRIARGRPLSPLEGPLVLFARPAFTLVRPWNTGSGVFGAVDLGVRFPLGRAPSPPESP